MAAKKRKKKKLPITDFRYHNRNVDRFRYDLDAQREIKSHLREPVVAIDPVTRGMIFFPSKRQVRGFFGGQLASYSIPNAIYSRKLFMGYYWCWARSMPAFFDWEMDRCAPWYPAYINRNKPTEPWYREVSVSGVPYRIPNRSFTL